MKVIATAVFLMMSAAASAQMGHGARDHSGHSATMTHSSDSAASASAVPTQPGQGAFAAIQEIVEILESDPSTDWTVVDIEALRQHLADMNNVTLGADVTSSETDGGMRFVISGAGEVSASIRRMVIAHAATMNGGGDWTFSAEPTEIGAILTVGVPPSDLPKLKALGFIGVMTRGMHHQEHHLMIARGHHPH